MKQSRSNIKTSKIIEELGFILEITIDIPSKEKLNIWHISVQMDNKKVEETIIPKDIFGYAIENYVALLNFFRVLHHSTEALRKQLNTLSRLPKNHRQTPNPNPPVHQIQKSKHQKQEEHRQAQQKQRSVSMLASSLETVKKNVTGNSMLEQTALALALYEVSMKQINKELQKNSKFKIIIPITKYPDLSTMQQQHSLNWLSLSESVLNFGGNILSKIPSL